MRGMEVLDGLEYLTVAEVSALKNITQAGVYGAIRGGRLPFRKIAKSSLVLKEDALAWEPAGHGGAGRNAGRRKGVSSGE